MSSNKSPLMLFIFLLLAMQTKPAQATYQDSVLLQYLLTQMNYIMEAINKVGFAVEQYVSYVSEYTKMNAQKQATEVKAGVIADQTKTLGTEEIKDHFYVGPTIQMNGKSYRVMSVASSGCFGLKVSKVKDVIRQKKPDVIASMKDAREALVESNDGVEEQFARGVSAIKRFQERENRPIFGSVKSISQSELMDRSDMASIIANKSMFSTDLINNWELGGENSHDLYRLYTDSIASVLDETLIDSMAVSSSAFGSDLSKNDLSSMTSILANDYSLTLANNVKLEKGRKAQLVENAYRLLDIKLSQLKRQRQQEKLFIVMAHQTLKDMHKDIMEIR